MDENNAFPAPFEPDFRQKDFSYGKITISPETPDVLLKKLEHHKEQWAQLESDEVILNREKEDAKTIFDFLKHAITDKDKTEAEVNLAFKRIEKLLQLVTLRVQYTKIALDTIPEETKEGVDQLINYLHPAIINNGVDGEKVSQAFSDLEDLIATASGKTLSGPTSPSQLFSNTGKQPGTFIASTPKVTEIRNYETDTSIPTYTQNVGREIKKTEIKKEEFQKLEKELAMQQLKNEWSSKMVTPIHQFGNIRGRKDAILENSHFDVLDVRLQNELRSTLDEAETNTNEYITSANDDTVQRIEAGNIALALDPIIEEIEAAIDDFTKTVKEAEDYLKDAQEKAKEVQNLTDRLTAAQNRANVLYQTAEVEQSTKSNLAVTLGVLEKFKDDYSAGKKTVSFDDAKKDLEVLEKTLADTETAVLVEKKRLEEEATKEIQERERVAKELFVLLPTYTELQLTLQKVLPRITDKGIADVLDAQSKELQSLQELVQKDLKQASLDDFKTKLDALTIVVKEETTEVEEALEAEKIAASLDVWSSWPKEIKSITKKTGTGPTAKTIARWVIETPTGQKELSDGDRWSRIKTNFDEEIKEYLDFLKSNTVQKIKDNRDLISFKNSIVEALLYEDTDQAKNLIAAFREKIDEAKKRWAESEKKKSEADAEKKKQELLQETLIIELKAITLDFEKADTILKSILHTISGDDEKARLSEINQALAIYKAELEDKKKEKSLTEKDLAYYKDRVRIFSDLVAYTQNRITTINTFRSEVVKFTNPTLIPKGSVVMRPKGRRTTVENWLQEQKDSKQAEQLAQQQKRQEVIEYHKSIVQPDEESYRSDPEKYQKAIDNYVRQYIDKEWPSSKRDPETGESTNINEAAVENALGLYRSDIGILGHNLEEELRAINESLNDDTLSNEEVEALKQQAVALAQKLEGVNAGIAYFDGREGRKIAAQQKRGATTNKTLKDNRETYSPALDKTMDDVGRNKNNLTLRGKIGSLFSRDKKLPRIRSESYQKAATDKTFTYDGTNFPDTTNLATTTIPGIKDGMVRGYTSAPYTTPPAPAHSPSSPAIPAVAPDIPVAPISGPRSPEWMKRKLEKIEKLLTTAPFIKKLDWKAVLAISLGLMTAAVFAKEKNTSGTVDENKPKNWAEFVIKNRGAWKEDIIKIMPDFFDDFAIKKIGAASLIKKSIPSVVGKPVEVTISKMLVHNILHSETMPELDDEERKQLSKIVSNLQKIENKILENKDPKALISLQNNFETYCALMLALVEKNA